MSEIFFAADGVHLLNCKNEGEIVGQGTGDVKLHLDALTEGNVKMFVSGMSSKAREFYDESLLEGYNAEFAMPDTLIKRSRSRTISVLTSQSFLKNTFVKSTRFQF